MGEVVRLPAATRDVRSARSKQKLTKRIVEAIAADPARELQRWDSELKGYGVRVMPSGVRTYFVQYRDKAARTRKVALGRHGVITTEEARNRARQVLGSIAGGKNPAAERKTARAEAHAARTVRDIASVFLAHVERRRKPSTVQSYTRLVESRILPRLGGSILEDITHDEALRLPDAKAGARDVPLSGAAVALLEGVPRLSDHVVNGRLEGEPLNKWTLETAWQRLRKRADLEDARLHDLRHTVGTFAGAAGLNAFAVRDLLGHKSLAMTGRYVSQNLNPLRRAADQAVDPIARALAGEQGQAAAEGIPSPSAGSDEQREADKAGVMR